MVLAIIMSRQDWFFECRDHSLIPDDESQVRSNFEHTPMSGRTSDPEALNWDEACEIFFNGVRLARCGDIKAARANIATAYLLDPRAINYVHFLPDHMASSLKMLYIDAELLFELSQAETDNVFAVSYGAHVIRIMSAAHLATLPKEGQTILLGALGSVNYLLQRLEEQPELEDPDPRKGALGGCLNRPALLFQRANLLMAMGNRKAAANDLTIALQIDSKRLEARDARASLWAGLNLKDNQTVFSEYKIISQEAHPDFRGLEVAFGWLALKILQDPTLGTLNDAKEYYMKCLRASQRQAELYGAHKPGEEPQILTMLQKQYAMAMGNLAWIDQRARLDTMDPATDEVAAGFGSMKIKPDKKAAYACFKCGKTAADLGKPTLKKCNNCKTASYCSRECQTSDWREHKVFCKNLPKIKSKIFASPKEDPSSKTQHPNSNNDAVQKSTKAKTPITEMEANAQANERMEQHLTVLWRDYGQGFAAWWQDMSPQKRQIELLDVTNNTLPKRLDKQVVSFRLSVGCMSASCFEANLETLLGGCSCAKDKGCPHFFNDRLLHEMFRRATYSDEENKEDFIVCVEWIEQGIFPNLFGNAKASVALYLLTRKIAWLSLLIKIFDVYQEKVRRCLPTHPYVRLLGCEHCRQSCSDQEAAKCSTCNMAWWCCSGCRKASPHGRKCPHGRPMESTVLFSSEAC